MDREKRYFLIGGFAAVLFYLTLLLLLLFFFNDYKRSKRYVPKKSQNIEVSILLLSSKKKRQKRKIETKKKTRLKTKTKTVRKPTAASPKSAKTVTTKAISSLFKGVKADIPAERSVAARVANAPKIRYKPSSEKEQKNSESASRLVQNIKLSKPQIDITSKSSGVGEVDEYMSKLYEIIYKTWRPEAVFAGEEARVRLHIAPDGSFSYALLYPSDNQGFNQSLIEYLERLRKRGLPPHKNGTTMDVDIEFKAKE